MALPTSMAVPELARSVLEGVGFALAQGMDVLHECGVQPKSIMLIPAAAHAARCGDRCWRISVARRSIIATEVKSCQALAPQDWRSWRWMTVSRPTPTLVQRHQPDRAQGSLPVARETFAALYQQLLPPLMK